jgi:hypothetical protein
MYMTFVKEHVDGAPLCQALLFAQMASIFAEFPLNSAQRRRFFPRGPFRRKGREMLLAFYLAGAVLPSRKGNCIIAGLTPKTFVVSDPVTGAQWGIEDNVELATGTALGGLNYLRYMQGTLWPGGHPRKAPPGKRGRPRKDEPRNAGPRGRLRLLDAYSLAVHRGDAHAQEVFMGLYWNRSSGKSADAVFDHRTRDTGSDGFWSVV